MNKYSVTSAGLGEGLARTASALQLAGNTFEEASAMIGATAEVTQDPEKAGNAMKTLSLRLRGMKGELQALGEESEGVENVSKMQGQILNMTKGKVNIFDDAGNFKSTYDIMKGIAEVYDDLSSTDQADLLETIAGKNRANDVAALISHFDTAIKMVDTAENAAGSARSENEKYLDSLQGRIDVMTSSIQAFSTTALDSSLFKGIISGATEAIDVFSSLIDTIGVIPTIIGAAATGFSLFDKGIVTVDKANGKLKLFGQNISDIKNLIGSLFTGDFGGQFNSMFGGQSGLFDSFKQQLDTDAKAYKEYRKRFASGMSGEQLNSALAGASSELRQYIENTDEASRSWDDFSRRQKQSTVAIQAQNRSLKSSAGIIKEYNNGCRNVGMTQEEFVQAVSSTNPVMGQYLSSLSGTSATMGGYVKSLVGATAKTIALTAASTALNAVLTAGIGIAIGAVVTGIMSLINYYDDLADSVEASSSAFETANSTLMNNKSAYDEAVQSYDKLSSGVNKFGENVSLSSEEYEEYKNAVNTIADSVPSVVAGFDSQGNAILNTAENVDTLTQAYNELIAAEAKAYVKGDEEKGYVGGDKIFEDYIHDLESMQRDDLESYQRLNELLSSENIDQYITDMPQGDIWNIRDRLKEMGLTQESGQSDAEFIAESIRNDTETVRNAVTAQMTEYENMASEAKQLTQSMLNEIMYTDDSFLDMDDSVKSMLTSYVSNLDGAFYEELVNKNDGNKSKALQGLQDYINSITERFAGLTETQQQTISDAFNMQVDFDYGNVTMEEFAAKAREMDQVLRDIGLDEDARKEMMLSLGFEYDGEGNLKQWTADYEQALNRLKGNKSNSQIQELQAWMQDLSGSDVEILMDMELDGGETVDELQHLLDLTKALQGVGTIDIDVESSNIEALNTALSESNSATGLTTESMDALSNMYANIEGFDPARLFERTANGIHLNAQAMREYQEAYEQSNYDKIQKDLGTLRDEYDRLTEAMKGASTPAETAMLEAQRDDILNEISNVADLAAQYEGLTSSYNRWVQAKSGSEQGDMYDDMFSGIESTEELYNQGLVGTNEFREFVQMMTDEDLSNASIETIMGVYEKGMPLMKRYFTEGADGVQNFLNDIQNLNSEWAHMNEDGSWEFNFGEGNDEAIADALGLSTEQVQAMIRKLNDYGFEVEIDSEFTGLEDLKTQAEEAEETLQNLAAQGKVDFDYEFNFDTTDIDYLDEQIEEANSLLDQFRNQDGTVNIEAEGATEAQTILATLLQQKASLNQPAIMQIEVEDPSSEIGAAVSMVQSLYAAIQERDINIQVGADASSAEAKIGEIAGKLAELQQENPQVYAQLGLNTSEFNSALATINDNVTVGATLDPAAVSTIQSGLAGISADVFVNVAGINQESLNGLTGSATIDAKPASTDLGNGFTGDATITVKPDKMNLGSDFTGSATISVSPSTRNLGNTFYGSGTITIKKNYIEGNSVNGTAHANGTAGGRAFKKGNWSTKEDGVALVGELGQETVVRDGHFFTVGDNGAEFFNYKKGDIIFNHKYKFLWHYLVTSNDKIYLTAETS